MANFLSERADVFFYRRLRRFDNIPNDRCKDVLTRAVSRNSGRQTQHLHRFEKETPSDEIGVIAGSSQSFAHPRVIQFSPCQVLFCEIRFIASL